MQPTQKKINRSSAIKIARQYISLCSEINLHINKAFLFGSFAKGTAKDDSDIDLLLVSDQFKPNTLENWKMLAPVTAKLYQVEPHPYPTKNFIKGDPFLQEIKKSSIEIRMDK